jgi:DNA-binding NtrC family response regulator
MLTRKVTWAPQIKTPVGKETILILDDESHIRWTLKALLESEGYVVITAKSVEGIQQNFLELKIAAFITEYFIKHSPVLDTIRKVKKTIPELYVMVLTNATLKETEYEELMDAGADDFFLKPFPSRKVLLQLQKGLKQRSIFLEKEKLERELEEIKANGAIRKNGMIKMAEPYNLGTLRR